MNNMQTLIVNIYAPVGYNNAKKEFFDDILEVIANHDGENIILGGDFNITLTDMDSLRRRRTDAEKQIADNINIRIAQNELSDAFNGKNGYTWGRGETRSRLDRIFTRLPIYKQKIRHQLDTSKKRSCCCYTHSRTQTQNQNEKRTCQTR